MAHTATPEFEVEVRIQGSIAHVTVKTEETTDGIPYYVCSVGDKQLSELRRGTDGAWMQIWGSLEGHDIKALGSAIDKETLT